jgi:hypothetical protein
MKMDNDKCGAIGGMSGRGNRSKVKVKSKAIPVTGHGGL